MNKEKLIQKIVNADTRYFEYGDSPYSDDEYDELKEQLRKIDPKNPLFTMIGSKINGEKTKLPYIMGSLDKVKMDTVEKWLENHPGPYIASEKLDGVSFIVEILNGKVAFAATRGDGEYGKIITDKAKVFMGDNLSHIPGMVFLRGEAMLVGNEYKKLGFKNRRNGVAGILNTDGINNAKFITPYFYEMILWSERKLDETDSLNTLRMWGFNVPKLMYSSKLNIDDLLDAYSIFKSDNRDMDGVVISCKDCERENVLFPKNKVAFKVNVGGVKARIKFIEWKVSRTGRIIPVANIDPINIGGVTVEKVTAHNAEYIEKNKLGKDGEIKIVRSGDVIPYIISIEKPGLYYLPEVCPKCHSKLERKGVDLICINEDCGPQKYKRVAHFLRVLGVEYITKVTIEKLNLDTIEKCFEIDEYSISNVEGFGFKYANIIVEEMEKCLYTTPEKLIASFGIPMFGKRMSKLVIDSIKDNFDDTKEMVEYIFNMKPSELENIYGIGSVTAKYFSENIKKFKNTLDFLYDKGLTFERKSQKFDGVRFSLTGKGNFNRGEIVKLIENVGGIVGGVTKSTKYLVTSNVESKSGKMKKAQKYGINIIDYDQLMVMLKGE